MSSKKEIMQYALYVTKHQNEELVELAKKTKCENVIVLFDKALEVLKILARAQDLGCKMLVVDNEHTTMIESEDPMEQRSVLIFEKKSACIDVTKEVSTVLGFQRQIEATNGFGYPTDPFLA